MQAVKSLSVLYVWLISTLCMQAVKSLSVLYVCIQGRLLRDCTFVKAYLSLNYMPIDAISTEISFADSSTVSDIENRHYQH